MKKKTIPFLVCLILSLCLALAGCGGDSFGKINVSGKQDTNYTVYSNGGMAVQYGNYIYFVNGYAGYDDTDGKQNTWPNVVKGGLYRAELNGTKSGKDFVPALNADAVTDGMEFKLEAGRVKYDDTAEDVVAVQQIAPKRIGTSGYKEGGIFIYDDWVYFASPNNEKDKTGAVQTGKTDFFRAKLDGSAVDKVYTTENDSASSAYAFYKYNGAVYLVAQDGTDVISVRMAKKADKKVTIAQNVSSVLLPYSKTYTAGMNENTLNHFVYVLRAVTEDDLQKTGNAIEVMRPDGTSGGVFHSQGKSDTLEAVRDGLLFYRTTDTSNNTLINFTNLHDFLMGDDAGTYGDKAYRAYYGSAEHKDERRQLSGSIAVSSDYTSTYCFRPNEDKSERVFVLGAKSSGVDLLSNIGETVNVYNASATIVSLTEEYMYFTESSGNTIYRTRWDIPYAQKSEAQAREQVSDKDASAVNFNGDFCAGYIVYAGKVNGLADSYTFFKQVERVSGADSVFVGVRLESEVLAAPQIKLSGNDLTWDAVTNADSYKVYRKAGGVVTLEGDDLTATTFTVSDTGAGTYWVVAVSSTNDTISAKSNTVNK